MKKTVAYFYLFILLFSQNHDISATPSSSTMRDYSNFSTNELKEALIQAVKENNLPAVKKLIQAKVCVDVDITYLVQSYDWYDYETSSILEYAAYKNYVDIVKELARENPQLDSVQKAIIMASEKGHAEVLSELIHHPNVDVNASTKWGDKALTLAAKRNSLNTIKILLQNGADVNRENSAGDTALTIVAQYNAFNAIKFLLQSGANVNHKNNRGQTALTMAIRDRWESKNGYTQATQTNLNDVITVLIEAGADVNHRENDGNTALMRAIEVCDINAVKTLVKIPTIDTNRTDSDGNTPLLKALFHMRLSYHEGNKKEFDRCNNSQEIVAILAERPDVKLLHANKKGVTAIDLIKKIGK